MKLVSKRTRLLCAFVACWSSATVGLGADKPRDLGVAMTAAHSFTGEEIAAIGMFLGSPGYMVVQPNTTVTFFEGGRLARLGDGFGTDAPRSAAVSSGAYWNGSDVSIAFTLGRDSTRHMLDPGSMIVIGDAYTQSEAERRAEMEHRRRHGGVDAPSCTVTCGPGFYACCNFASQPGGNPTCLCKRVTDVTAECDAGGEGSPECSITQ